MVKLGIFPWLFPRWFFSFKWKILLNWKFPLFEKLGQFSATNHINNLHGSLSVICNTLLRARMWTQYILCNKFALVNNSNSQKIFQVEKKNLLPLLLRQISQEWNCHIILNLFAANQSIIGRKGESYINYCTPSLSLMRNLHNLSWAAHTTKRQLLKLFACVNACCSTHANQIYSPPPHSEINLSYFCFFFCSMQHMVLAKQWMCSLGFWPIWCNSIDNHNTCYGIHIYNLSRLGIRT